MEVRGRATLVDRSFNRCTVPVLGLRHLKATVIKLLLTERPAELVDVHQSPDRPLTDSDLL